MNDTKTPSKTLSLKRPVEAGVVRQSFSHGRTKTVVVEKVKRRAIGPGEGHGSREAPSAPPPPPPPVAPPVAAAPVAPRQPTPSAAPPPPAAPVAAAPKAAPQPSAPASAAPLAPPVAPTPAAPPAPVVAAAPATAAPATAVPVRPPEPTPVQSAAPAPAAPATPPQPAAPSPVQPAPRPAQAGPRPAQAGPRPAQGGPRPIQTAARPAQTAPRPAAASATPSRPQAPRGPTQAPRPPTRTPSGVVLRTLTEEERESRARALEGAREREIEDRKRAEAESKLRAEREERDRAERAAAEARKKEEDARRVQEADAKRRAETEAARRLAGGEPAPPPPPGAPRRVISSANATPPGAAPVNVAAIPRVNDEEEAKRIIRRPGMPTKVVLPPRPSRGGAQKDRGRLTVASVTGGEDERTRSVAAFRRRTQRLKGHVHDQKEKLSREVILPETITIQELANRMSERAVDVIKLLMKQGQMATINDVIDADTAQLIAEELGHTVKRVSEADVEEGLFDTPDIQDDHALPRPPVVTIMGHVDHGKTSLLDAIRKTHVVTGEAGGITQHIGAYQIIAPNGLPVTFIDTPGHAAFTAMRARGAKVTDIVVLVVAADDGVMPQTAEAIAHAKAAGVPMIVAINKIDKQGAKPERVRSELLQYEVQVESLGGDTIEVEVSATQRTNLDKLLEMIALQAEFLDLKANPDRPAEGTVIEARLDRGRGPVATVLVQRGTLKVGDLVVGGTQWGRVRALIDENGETLASAGPSVPVEVLGFSGSPEAGDRVGVVENESRAREITAYRDRQKREIAAARVGGTRSSLVDMMSQLKTAGRKEFPLVIKGDVQGSVEAIVTTLEELNTDEVAARILQAGVGGITESDVTLAEASNAVIIGFNVRALKEARNLAEQSGVEIRYYNVIYNLVDDVKAAMSGMLDPTLREDMLGNAQILEIFDISKVGKVAGCRITDGHVERGAHVRLIRDNVVVHEGKLSTLKRFKDEVKDVVAGQECGMAFETYKDMRVGDIIECYTVTAIQRSL